MGYRSDITMCCAPKAYEMIKDVYQKFDFTPDADNEICDGIHTLKWYSRKWNGEDYKEVDAIENIMQKLTEDGYSTNADYAFKCIDVGEEEGDIIYKSNEAGSAIFAYFYDYTAIRLPQYDEIRNCTRAYENSLNSTDDEELPF